MSKNIEPKNHMRSAAFAAYLGVSASALTAMKKSGRLPEDCFQKSGRFIYVHEKKAVAVLKVAPVPQRGRIPVWAEKVGNKAMMKALKERGVVAAAA